MAADEPATWYKRVRHYGGFIVAGLAALAMDALVLWLLTIAGAPPLLARLPSIAIAMLVSWTINRRVTFGIVSPPTWTEFKRFAFFSISAQVVNYTAFAAILIVRPETWPVAALIGGSVFAMFFAYAGFRYGVFRKA